jgi:hypothetical protein
MAKDYIPQAARTALANAYAAWYTAYAATIGPHTPVDTEAQAEADVTFPGGRKNALILTRKAGTRCTSACAMKTAKGRPARSGRC